MLQKFDLSHGKGLKSNLLRVSVFVLSGLLFHLLFTSKPTTVVMSERCLHFMGCPTVGYHDMRNVL